MDANEALKQMNRALDEKRWDDALQLARRVPPNWGPYQQFPYRGIPREVLPKFLSAIQRAPSDERANAFFELSSNLPEDYTHEDLRSIGEAHGALENDGLTERNLREHPNFDRTHHEDIGHNMATEFWRSFERKVGGSHHAAIKSLITGKPEQVMDHRGQTGNSHDSYIADGFVYTKDESPVGFSKVSEKPHPKNGFPIHMAIPHLMTHAKKVQDRIMKDKYIPKRQYNGKTYVKLHRGVGGDYGKAIHEAANYDPHSQTADDKQLKIPVSHMTSWTVNPDMARRFAGHRGNIEGQSTDHGTVLSSWVPLENVLHSGFHDVHIGQEHPHREEEELVVLHKEPHIKVPTKSMEFQLPSVEPERGLKEINLAKPKSFRPKK